MPNHPQEREMAQPDSWKTQDMPKSVALLPFNKAYTAEEFSVLRYGLIPEVMEDKWGSIPLF